MHEDNISNKAENVTQIKKKQSNENDVVKNYKLCITAL